MIIKRQCIIRFVRVQGLSLNIVSEISNVFSGSKPSSACFMILKYPPITLLQKWIASDSHTLLIKRMWFGLKLDNDYEIDNIKFVLALLSKVN